jgi:hypothetical protein
MAVTETVRPRRRSPGLGLIGGQSYGFDCWTIGRDGNEWLRYERFGQSWWALRFMLHPPYGESEPPLPHC